VAEVDHVHCESVNEHLIIDIHWPLWNGKESVLTNEILEPEVVIVMDRFVVEWVLFREETPSERFKS